MNDNKIVISVIIATFLILAGGIAFSQKIASKPEIKESQNAKAQVDKLFYDWGEIPISGGDVGKTFTISNVGTDPLQLHSVKTSCMCTEAKIKINGKTSPSFGMHQRSNWVGEVPAGGAAEVEVVFDPDYHGPSGVGAITRQVEVSTNDEDNPKIIFKLEADVVN